MSVVNGAVTAGYEFVYDSAGEILITKDRLNLLSLPTVTVDISNAVDSEDLVASAVTAAKLANAVADAFVVVTAVVAAEDSNNVDVTVQAFDLQGNALLEQVGIWAWISTASGGAPGALPSGGAPVIVGTDGTIVQAMSAAAAGLYLTTAAGKLVLRFTEAGALTRYFCGVVGAKLYLGDAAMTWV